MTRALKTTTNLKQLSEILKLSQTTVSRALNGFPEVSEKTRQRVLQAAEQQNYAPNARAKRLATGRSMAIGHVVPVSTEHEMVNPIFADFIAGASARYAQSGYDLLLTLVADEDEFSTYKDLVARSAVDGVVVHAPKINDSRIALLNDLDLPFVVHGRSSGITEEYNWVDVNNEGAFFTATEYLIETGHKRIALINGQTEMDFAMRRMNGYRRALAEYGIAFSEQYLFAGEMTEPYGRHSAMQLLQGANPPTAIIASSMIVANGVRRAVHDMGLELGRDISVVTHDDDLSYFRDDSAVPVFTATRSSVREAGTKSADLLINAIEKPNQEKHGILLKAKLKIGQSTAPLK